MTNLMNTTEAAGQISQLTGIQRENPCQVLRDFFCDLNLTEIKTLLGNIAETCLTTDDGPFGWAEERMNLIYQLKKIEQALEASYLIYGQQKATI